MSRPKNFYKKYFVSYPIQGSVLARCLGYMVCYHLFLWHVMFMHAYLTHQESLSMGGPALTFRELYGNFTQQNLSFLVCSVAILPIMACDLIRFSHRIAGPLVRVRNELNRLTRDESVAPIRLRKGDLMQDVVDAFNRFLVRHAASKSNTEASAIHHSDASENHLSSESGTLEKLNEIQSEVNEHLDKSKTQPASFTSETDKILLRTEQKWG